MRAGSRDVELFRFEYHPLDGLDHRIRILTTPRGLRVLTEERAPGGWETVDATPIGYFEYSDEDTNTSELV